jgi:hypothetical protein
MVFEALRDALESIASVRVFPADDGIAGLLRSVSPDAVIVDNDEEARRAEPVARELGIALVHLGLHERYVRVFRDGGWHAADQGDGLSPETVRNIVAGGLYGRGRAR